VVAPQNLDIFPIPVSAPVSPRALHDRLYAGDVLEFTPMPAMQEIVSFTRGFLEEEFQPHDPTEIHHYLPRAELNEAARARSRAYNRSEEAKRLWRELFEAIGLDPEALARDRLYVRFQPPEQPDASPPERGVSTVRFHRDTWGTNLYAQVNWWAPVYPITAGRTVALYPTLWSKPVANTSAEFDIGAAIASHRRPGSAPAVDPLPHLSEDVSWEPAIPVVIDPGSILTFSSAHAHAGVPNNTGITRISLETRTLWIEDVRLGKGAPNIDGDGRFMSPGLFRRLNDEAKLEQVLGLKEVEPYVRSGSV
jgi:hypothetical protein